ncbi:MAG: ribosome small subunit-dependent GTPase A [Flavobacteriia bacterium]|nr:ribosome small subunit-dependent GTPase A [Flavobacteriia bacterium]
MEARVLKSTGSWYVIETEVGAVHAARLRGRLRQGEKKLTNPIAAGDRVLLSDEKDDEGNYAIEKVLPRLNYLSRKATNLSKEMQLLAANIDTFYLVVTLRLPETHPLFIDRFLVAAESFRIPSVLLFNKTDLYEEKDKVRFLEWKTLYEAIGYPCYPIQSNDPTSLGFLKELIRNKQVMLGGNSGVGKSSLVNALDPGLDLRTGTLSTAHRQGKHTTTFAEMHKLAFGAYIIDTPGIRSFGLIDLEKAHLPHYFPEFRARMENCRFNNCMHLNEPGCAVREALTSGEIHPQRYAHYVAMLEENEDEPYRRDKYA